MKRTILIFVNILLLIGLYSCNSADSASAEKSKEGFYDGTIKVGHLVALDMAPLFIAKEKGFFKEEGLTVETVFFSNPGDNNAALAGGSIQLSVNPFTLPYFANNSGLPMRIISGAGGIGMIEVIIQGDLKIETVKDLVQWIKNNPGKKIKIAVLKGDTLEMIVEKLLADNGLTYDNVEMVWFSDLLAMVQAFETKQVDILSHIKPYTTDMIVHHGAKSLATSTEVWGEGTPNCTVNVMEKFLEKYPATCKAYLKALDKAFHFIVDNPDQAADLLQKGNYYKVSNDVLLYALKNQPKKVLLHPDTAGMTLVLNALIKAGYVKQSPQNVVNTTLLDQIEKQ